MKTTGDRAAGIGLSVVVAIGLLAAPPATPRLRAAPSCQISGVDRVVAVGDVHGAYDQFVALLRVAHVIDSQDRWSGGKTHLVQLGDIVDRGPDSRKALDLVRRLEKDATRAGGAVHMLLGNHEVMRMLGDLRFVTPGEYATFATQESPTVRERYLQALKLPASEDNLKAMPLGLVELRIAFGQQGPYGSWLRDLNAVLHIDGVVFVHGGLSPSVAAMSCEEINSTVRRELTKDLDKTRQAPLASLAAREDGPLWYRGLAQAPDDAGAEIADMLSKQHAQALVVAHTVVTDGRIRARFGGTLWQIDTGMQPAYVIGGRASALEIRHGVFTAIYEDREEVLRDVSAEVPGHQ